MTTAYARDIATRRTAGGVRTDPSHWANAPVHAHRTWVGEHTLETWCGLLCDMEAGARQTTDLIGCRQCSEASWQEIRGSRQ